MICTSPSTAGPSNSPSTRARGHARSCAIASGPAIFPFPGPAPTLSRSPREIYLRALEQEREEILAEAYSKNKASTSSNSHSHVRFQPNFDPYSSDDDDDIDSDSRSVRFDERGRQLDFVETVRQRQARLEFLRRQEFARRLAHKGLENAAVSAYAIKRLPPPRALPIERVNAAIKIQRAYRTYRTIQQLSDVILRTRSAAAAFSASTAVASSPFAYEARWREYAETLYTLLNDLASITGVVSSTSNDKGVSSHFDPRIRAAAREATEVLRNELARLDRSQVPSWSSYADSEDGEYAGAGFLSYSDYSSSSSLSSDSDTDSEYDFEDPEYPLTPSSTSELFVVNEEDEEEDDENAPSPEMIQLFSKSAEQHQKRLPISTVSPRMSYRCPVARSPSLNSIPEHPDF